MRNHSIKYILILVLGVLVSCTPGGSGRRVVTGAQAPGEDSPFPNTSPTVSGPIGTTEDIVWWSGGFIDGALLVNADINTVVYIRGVDVNTFLNVEGNFMQQYCLVANFNIDGVLAKKQLRAVISPDQFESFGTGQIEKLFRVNIENKEKNEELCRGLAPHQAPPGAVVNITDPDIAYSPADLCPTCNLTVTATELMLYKIENNLITGNQVPSTSLDINSIALRIDTSSTSEDPIGTCTDETCQQLGYDCCVAGQQCVNDGSQKGDFTGNLEFLQAIEDIKIDPQNYKKYPQFFHICEAAIIPTPTPTATPDAPVEADLHLKGLIFDMYCLEEFEASSDITRCLTDNQCFQGVFTVADLTVKDFSDVDLSACTTNYQSVKNRIYKLCGCEANDATPPPGDPATLCPDYKLKAVLGIDGIIENVVCDIPPPPLEPTPIQNLDVSVEGNRAPHRLYRASDGSAIDIIETMVGTAESSSNPFQEGDYFEYLDPVSAVVPNQQPFSMNAILGQMNLTLSNALPALFLPIKTGQQYTITVNSGNYTPCGPTCSEDAWFRSFFTHAPSNFGTGLSAFGFTTSRDTYSNNKSKGNYEDTLFGRACFVPPTMLPFAHKAEANVQTQRMNRLKTQAAMFVNGYKRDWFGFNQGALIGSFNGVNWFSIGSGRVIQATSNKLYLAINAPYADVARSQATNVSVIEDNGSITSLPATDFDPNLSPYDENQNKGATCQAYHQCETDSDCINQLGWEYMCAETGAFRSLMPEFDLDANELSNDSKSSSYSQILQGGFIDDDSTKRCVYRGAGAPCKRNYTSLGRPIRKLFTCAPNFYCESVTGNFNNKINRSIKNLGFVKFGQGAKVLGRPEDYVGGNSTLPAEVIDNLQANAVNQDSSFTATEIGLCRPGKFIDTANSDPNFVDQHEKKDNARRTDYISQIGSCDPEAVAGSSLEVAIKRTQTCPLIDSDGDYLFTKDNSSIVSSADQKDEFWKQNSCGGEAIQTTSSLSPFDSIESGILGVSATLTQKSFAKHACFRRAGSVCFSNYDCAPNGLHANQADTFGLDFFGGTEAEKNYWEEPLVCGQGQPQPNTEDINTFLEYDLRLNKCCRPTGEEITLYTQGDPTTDSSNPNLDVTLFSVGDPNGIGRYSRYSVVGQLQTTDTNPNASPFYTAPIMPPKGTSPTRFQWKTINDTASNTCCGGGWIRKFSDGTHDWNNVNRLKISTSNLSCINYNTSVALERPDKVTSTAYNRDFFKLCQDPTQNGCVQVSMQDTAGFNIVNPVFDLDFGGELQTVDSVRVAALNTFPFSQTPDAGGDPVVTQRKSFFVPFMPTVVDGDGPLRPENSTDNFFQSGFEYVSIQLPSYINDRINIHRVYSTNTDGNKNQELLNCEESGDCSVCDPSQNQATEWIAGVIGDNRNWWCLNESTGILHAKRARQVPGSMPALGLYIEFFPVNTPDHRYGPNSAPVLEPFKTGVHQPGNDLYYLTKLARFELLGIPQIFYEPIYCNSNVHNIVPGLYKDDAGSEITTRTEFESDAYFYDGAHTRLSQIYDDSASAVDVVNSITVGASDFQYVVNQENVNINPIFSGHEFQCCLELGAESTDPTKCCSNFAAARNEDDATLVCKLPTATNLSVYFNRFVSSDGKNEDASIGLTDDDFNPTTGEPRMQNSTYQKLFALGEQHCENGAVRVGASFGEFTGEPNGGNVFEGIDGIVAPNVERRYGIVDSFNDFDPSFTTPPSPRSLRFYNAGFKWTHHVYCSDLTQEEQQQQNQNNNQ